MKTNIIIVGQGLAGSLLAWQFLKRGKRVLVVDEDRENTSSKVAAGLVTPISGTRFNLPPDLEEALGYAKQFYWDLEAELDTEFFYHTRIAKLFGTEEERLRWKSRMREAESGQRLAKFQEDLKIDSELFKNQFGGFEMKGGGWMDVPRLLELTRQHLLERVSYAIGRLDSADVRVNEQHVAWKNVKADHIVFCQGWRGNENSFFDWMPMNPAKGEILDLEIPALEKENRIINKNAWLLPRGGGKFRCGSNYDHHFDSIAPSEAGRAVIESKISRITDQPFRVTGHRSGIRPIIRRSRVVMGTHPTWPRVAFFNGLGSKGVLNGPLQSARLCDHILKGSEISAEFDLRSLR